LSTLRSMPGRSAYEVLGQKFKHFHNRLRSELQSLIKDCEALCASEAPKPAAKVALCRSTAQFLQHLDNHHSIEDAYIFPMLALRISVARLESDHQELEDRIHDLRIIIRRANEGVDIGALHERLVGLREMMFPHMLLEESLTKPAALQAAGFNERELAMFA